MHHFPLMAQFNEWANARLYDCVARLPGDDYRRDAGIFFGSIHATLNHLLLVDRLWCARIEEAEHGFASLTEILYDDLKSLRAARVAEDAGIVALVDSLSAEDMGRPVRYRRMIGSGTEETRIGHILATVFNHQTHHRGHVTAVVSQCGVEPPPLDVIYYLEEIGESGDAGTVKVHGSM